MTHDVAHEVFLGASSIASICDAFGKGFDQCNRNLANPYALESAEHTAYQYGMLRGHDEESPVTPAPAGWVMVPTRAMIDAGVHEALHVGLQGRNWPEYVTALYKVMCDASPAAPAVSNPDGYEEAWLIEPIKQTGLMGPEYWGRDDDEDCGFGWTWTLENAMRFSRKQDAEAMIELMGWTEVHAVDHAWGFKAPAETVKEK